MFKALIASRSRWFVGSSNTSTFGFCSIIRQERLEHRRLADAVAADEHDLLAAVHDGAEVGDHGVRAERLRDALALERDLARRPVHGELDVRALDVRPRQLGGLEPLDFLLA